MQRYLPPTLGILAFMLILLGVGWNWLYPQETYWSPQQAEEYQDAFNDVHAAQDAVKHPEQLIGDANFTAARERYERIRGELQQAQRARQRTGKYVAITGLVLLLSSVLLRNYWGPPEDASDASIG